MRRVVSPAQLDSNSTVSSASRSAMHLQIQSLKWLTRLSGMGATMWALSHRTIVYRTAWPTILHLRQENKQLRMPKQLHKPTLMWDFWLLTILLILGLKWNVLQKRNLAAILLEISKKLYQQWRFEWAQALAPGDGDNMCLTDNSVPTSAPLDFKIALNFKTA